MSPVLEATIVATFADQCVALASPEDGDLREKRWRRDPYGYVVRSGGQRGRSNIYLARVVADRMGLEPGGIGFLDGDPLNCTRSNIWLAKPGMDRKGKSPSTHTRQPRGFHRTRLRPIKATGLEAPLPSSVPPSAYVLKWHQGPCEFTSETDQSNCSLAASAEVIGMAVRKTRVTGPGKGARAPGGHVSPDGWEFTDLTGRTYPTKSYDEGCRWVIAGRDLIHRHAPAVCQGPMLELMRTLEGP